MNDKRTELLTESPWRLMLRLGIPAIIGMVVVGLYSLVDAIFVGQLVGATAMGGVSVSTPFTLINSGISTLVGMGSASLLSRAIGKKDSKTVDKIMGNLLLLVLILSLIAMLVVFIFIPQLLKLSGASGKIHEIATSYLRIVFIGSFFINFSQSANMIMRGEGEMKKAMLIMGSGAIINIILDPILIVATGYKMEGAAIATVISQIIQGIITFIYFKKFSKNIKFNGIKIEKSFLKPIFSVGVSAMLLQVMTFVQQLVLYNTAARYGGDNLLILVGAASRIQSFSFIPMWGLSQGLQPAVGTNYGAKLFGRVKKVNNVFMIGAVILTLIYWIPIQLFPNALLGLFITDSSIVSEGIVGFRVMFSILPALGILILSMTFFQSLGKGTQASVLVILRQILLFIPLALLLPMYMGGFGVWLAVPLTDGIVLLMSIVFILVAYKKDLAPNAVQA